MIKCKNFTIADNLKRVNYKGFKLWDTHIDNWRQKDISLYRRLTGDLDTILTPAKQKKRQQWDPTVKSWYQLQLEKIQ